MRNILLILLMLISSAIQATDHYVATGGGGTGTIGDPFGTIAQVNAHTFAAGDRILFNRSNTFIGTLTVSNSGSAGSPITYGAYDTGDNPIISGFTTLTGWTNEGNSIYSKTIAVESNFTNIVTVNGVNTGMGRYPNTGMLTYESHVDHTSITDNQLTNTPNWTGAQVVWVKVKWVLDRATITNHTNSVLTYTGEGDPVYSPTNTYGYFIQSDLKTLDVANEWYYDGSKFYIYSNPSAKTVKISTTNRLMVMSGKNYITVENITFEGANSHAIQNTSGHDIIIQNCSFLNEGMTGIYTVASGNDNTLKFGIYPTTISDIQIEYNGTSSIRTVNLTTPMIASNGTKYASSITLQPYTSVILIVDPDYIPVVGGETLKSVFHKKTITYHKKRISY
jgi:hypothetical protein